MYIYSAIQGVASNDPSNHLLARSPDTRYLYILQGVNQCVSYRNLSARSLARYTVKGYIGYSIVSGIVYPFAAHPIHGELSLCLSLRVQRRI